ncbi:MAG: hypothetical protein SF339_17210 [Blastocatellia bacterium]|nr:hypothetical protein [Blastocatellia bacterium]
MRDFIDQILERNLPSPIFRAATAMIEPVPAPEREMDHLRHEAPPFELEEESLVRSRQHWGKEAEKLPAPRAIREGEESDDVASESPAIRFSASVSQQPLPSFIAPRMRGDVDTDQLITSRPPGQEEQVTNALSGENLRGKVQPKSRSFVTTYGRGGKTSSGERMLGDSRPAAKRQAQPEVEEALSDSAEWEREMAFSGVVQPRPALSAPPPAANVASSTIVRVNIGRIEIAVPQPAPSTRPSTRPAAAPARPLSEYLRQRNGGRK